MIEINNVSKSFGEVNALVNVELQIQRHQIFGLIGSNGAGKSTLMRIIAGVLKPDNGEVLLEGQPIFENVEKKRRMFYMSDNQYFPASYNGMDIFHFYNEMYKTFDQHRFDNLMNRFNLEKNRKVNTYSKGMKKQLSMVLGLSSGASYLLCDETFDGLDPIAKQGAKALLQEGIISEQITPIITSHNLRELEDICDHVGMLHQGGVLMNEDLSEIKLGVIKIQLISEKLLRREDFQPHKVMEFVKRGSLYTVTIKGSNHDISHLMEKINPLFYEKLPLSLEEVFISETEVAGYDLATILGE